MEDFEFLERFVCQKSDDPVKTNLELVCAQCTGVICDVEDSDTLSLLARTTASHECPPRYDVLDQNGDVLDSTDSWWIANAKLADWQGGSIVGSIRDNMVGVE